MSKLFQSFSWFLRQLLIGTVIQSFMADYKRIDISTWYRRDFFRHFTEDNRCAVSMTNRIDVASLVEASKRMQTRFYLNFLWIVSKVINSREEYRLYWDWRNEELFLYDKFNPIQYIFHRDTETFTLAYSEYDSDYRHFYRAAESDKADAEKTREYRYNAEGHPNWFDASCVPWLSYDALHVELTERHLSLNPIIHWGKYREENGSLMMPVTARFNHAAVDGWLIADFFRKLESEILKFQTLSRESCV